MVALFFSGGRHAGCGPLVRRAPRPRATPLEPGSRMLDRVTTINAVSGGSFTAAYYCLYGDRIFAGFREPAS